MSNNQALAQGVDYIELIWIKLARKNIASLANIVSVTRKKGMSYHAKQIKPEYVQRSIQNDIANYNQAMSALKQKEQGGTPKSPTFSLMNSFAKSMYESSLSDRQKEFIDYQSSSAKDGSRELEFFVNNLRGHFNFQVRKACFETISHFFAETPSNDNSAIWDAGTANKFFLASTMASQAIVEFFNKISEAALQLKPLSAEKAIPELKKEIRNILNFS